MMTILGVLQGLATPAIACAGLLIAYQQKRLADIRLQNDLFDRRFKIFEAARKLIRKTCGNPHVPFEDLQAFVLDTADAAFFFKQDIVDYLDDLRRRVGRLNELLLVIERPELGDNQPAAVREKKDTLNWLNGEITGIVARFKASMGLNRHGWPP